MIKKKILAVMAEIGFIEKNQQGYDFKFRGIDDFYKALYPLFVKHGIFITSEILKHQREERVTSKGRTLLYSIIDVKFTFHCEDDSTVSCVITGEGMDSGDKATNKAMSIALKYALMQMFLVPTEELKDPDSESHQVEPKKSKRVEAFFKSIERETEFIVSEYKNKIDATDAMIKFLKTRTEKLNFSSEEKKDLWSKVEKKINIFVQDKILTEEEVKQLMENEEDVPLEAGK